MTDELAKRDGAAYSVANEQHLRLECLRLACRVGFSPDEAVATAKLFEAYVAGPERITGQPAARSGQQTLRLPNGDKPRR